MGLKMVKDSAAGFASLEDREALESGGVFAPRFNDDGQIPAIVTDNKTGDVLMFAWMNEEALSQTISTRFAHFWSRSRGRLWKKGEDSGNTLRVVELRTDCDQDVLWVRVDVEGSGAACHTGRRTCFYRAVQLDTGGTGEGSLERVDASLVFDPGTVYGSKGD